MRTLRGMSFIDVIVGIALILIIFTALTTLLSTSLKVSTLAKNRSIATSAAESQMEYLRSLDYDAVGTVGGIPAGLVPQYATTTSNGLTLVTRIYIAYVDDTADGFGALDANGITADYKQLKVSTTYYVGATPHVVTLVSNYAPLGIETTNGGGTLKVSVVSALGTGVPGATVRIVNASTTPTVDFSTFTDVNGVVYLPGAATSSEYQIYVSKTNYSSAQTYARDAVNQNPTPGYLTVAANQTTTGTFAIDQLGSFTLRTFSPIIDTAYTDSFSDGSGVSSNTNTVVSGGSVILTGGPLAYASNGTVTSVAVAPQYLSGWSQASTTVTLAGGTSLFHVLDAAGTLLPEALLPGNSAGFSAPVDLSLIPIGTYPSLRLSVDLTSADPSTTPSLDSWSIGYRKGPIPLASVPFTLTGAKTIGSTGASVPITKTTIATSSGALGVFTQNLEWDAYTLDVGSNTVVSACVVPPYVLAPGATIDSSLVLSSSTTRSLSVSTNSASSTLSGVAVTLSRTGYSKTILSDSCGNAYFGTLTPASDYSITATKAGYTTFNASNVTVSAHDFYEAVLN